jgi:hypothetical protein
MRGLNAMVDVRLGNSIPNGKWCQKRVERYSVKRDGESDTHAVATAGLCDGQQGQAGCSY